MDKKQSQKNDPLERFGQQLHGFKSLPRTGWWMRGLSQIETVGAHVSGVALWTLFLAMREQRRIHAHHRAHDDAAIRSDSENHPLPTDIPTLPTDIPTLPAGLPTHHQPTTTEDPPNKWTATEERPSIDIGTALTMALLHDLPEALIGDLVPQQKQILFGDDPDIQKAAITAAEERFWAYLCGEKQDKKKQDKKEAIDTDEKGGQTGEFASSDTSEESSLISEESSLAREATTIFGNWREAWARYRAKDSIEAILVKRADALDCVMQAIIYRRSQGASLAEFSYLIEQAAADDDELRTHLWELWHQSANLHR